jgi:hypothetical protein
VKDKSNKIISRGGGGGGDELAEQNLEAFSEDVRAAQVYIVRVVHRAERLRPLQL